ncbi:MAG: RDD family protein [Candidatus Rickettsia vulgarisii]
MMKKQIIYPTLIPRIFASTLDLFILSIVATPITTFINYKLSILLFKASIAEILVKAAAEQSESIPEISLNNLFLYIVLILIVNFCIVGMYFIGFWIRWGATPGKMIMHMKIVDEDTLEQPTKWQLIKRFFGYLTALLGIWSVVFSKQRQALHDKIAKTVVIKS